MFKGLGVQGLGFGFALVCPINTLKIMGFVGFWVSVDGVGWF